MQTSVYPSGNPIIRHKFTADPTVLVFDNKVYLYTGHDEPDPGSEAYVMKDWLCFSSADLVHWEEHPSPLKATDFGWAKEDAFASKLIERDGSFFWYAAVTHASLNGKAIAVAVGQSPVGPFKDAKGAPLISPGVVGGEDPSMANMDPTVLIDDDGQAYIFWGKSDCYYARLRKNMTELDGEIYPLQIPGFAEGAHIHKRNGWYYLSYGYGSPERVAYCMSRNISGPWEFKGILNELAGNCETNRPAILHFKGLDYFFYHNGGLEGGGSHRRSVCIDRLFYNADGTIKRIVMTSEGVNAV